eukprot:GHVU01104908.1.p1 GENE.GHVU01104908.1~~GHVU01104908.1.p1  ORF type:complete len:113 (-),score=14.85 GHVU01104908.1:190-528(-)
MPSLGSLNGLLKVKTGTKIAGQTDWYLQVHTSMPPDRVCEYVKHYELTTEGFRKKFRGVEPEVGETVHQFTVQIRMYLMCWVKMFQCEQSFDGLKDLIREVCVLEMLLFLRK